MPKTERAAQEDWGAHLAREEARYRDGEARLADDPGAGADADKDARQRQLTRLGNAAGGAGLSLLMLGRADEACGWFRRAADRYRESFHDAPPGSWGRPIGAVKSLVLAGDWARAEEAARWVLVSGAAGTDSPIGRYAAALALLVLGRGAEAREHADSIRTRDDFPNDVGNALAFLAAEDVAGYATAIESVLESFETATSTSRICPSPTPCSCCRRSQNAAGWRSSSARRCCPRRRPGGPGGRRRSERPSAGAGRP